MNLRVSDVSVRRMRKPGGAKARKRPETWGAAEDERLLDTGGAYAKIAALSNEWWIEERVLVARLHVARQQRKRRPRAEQKARAVSAPVAPEKAGRQCQAIAVLYRGETYPSLSALARAYDVNPGQVANVLKTGRFRGHPLVRVEA